MGGESGLELGCAVLARGGGESAKAMRDVWERVVEDGEVVMG